MPISIQSGSLYSTLDGIKYITALDNAFTPAYHSGKLSFYPGSPEYLVNVSIYGNKESFESCNINISLGDSHNKAELYDEIRKKHRDIYEIALSTSRMDFVLNLETMKIVTRDDFSASFPIRGVHTLFVFSSIKNSNFFCLINVNPKVNDRELFTWFLSYVYSSVICLEPNKEPTDVSKVFLQSLSSLLYNFGNKNSIFVTGNAYVLRYGTSNNGERKIKVPGITKRLDELYVKAIAEMYPPSVINGDKKQ